MTAMAVTSETRSDTQPNRISLFFKLKMQHVLSNLEY
jgi:hypothetical protein